MNSTDSRLQTKVRSLTVHKLLHTLNRTVNDPGGLSYGSPSLLLHESVRRLQDRLDVLVPEEFFLQKFSCVALSTVMFGKNGLDSLDRRCLGSSVTKRRG